MPPLPADFIHPRACKPICEKSLTLPEIEVEFKISATQFFDFLHPEGDKSVYYRAS